VKCSSSLLSSQTIPNGVEAWGMGHGVRNGELDSSFFPTLYSPDSGMSNSIVSSN